MTPNDTLLDQCRMDALKAWTFTPMAPEYRDRDAYVRIYASALYHERSKPRTSLSVEDIDACMDEIGDPPDNPDHFWLWREKVSARLTAKLNELNTPTNG